MNRREFLTALAATPIALQDSSRSVARNANRAQSPRQTRDRARPNILLILADDMGYSDLGCYGSEIHTPNIDRLAENGIRFTQFYSAARCCPSRASLLTGLYPHQAGVGHMLEKWHAPSYSDGLNTNTATIAEVLKAAGYRTVMTGKWHLGWKDEGSPAARGFDRFYGTRGYVDSYFTVLPKTEMYLDDTLLIGPTQNPANHLHPDQTWYTTDVFTDYAIHFMGEALRHGLPFFQYVAYNAPHFPLHSHKADIEKYRGKYRQGWDPTREARYRRQRESGLLQPQWGLSPSHLPPWDSLTAEQKDEADFRMAVYAAIVDRLDRNVGRLLSFLESRGQLGNTLVLFISDNGGSNETGLFGLNAEENKSSNYDQWQRTGGWTSSYGEGWATVSNTPFRLYKRYCHEGGIASPMMLHWPDRVRSKGEFRHQISHLIDILPTLAEVAGAEYPTQLRNEQILPLEGRSLVPAFDDKPISRDALYWEHEGNRAVRAGKWKLVARFGDPWALYDMEADRSEMHDLSAQYPEVATRLWEMYEKWARRCDVIPYDEVNPH